MSTQPNAVLDADRIVLQDTAHNATLIDAIERAIATREQEDAA